MMTIALLMAGGLMLVLFIGWRSYFREVEARQKMALLSARTESQLAASAAAQAAAIKEATQEMVSVPAPTATVPQQVTPAVTLTSQPDAGGTDSTFPEPEVLTQDVSQADLRDARETQRQFWAATTWKDKAQCVCDPVRVSPLMREFYEVRKETEPFIGDARQQAHFKLHATEILLFSYDSSRLGGTVDIAMIRQPDGKFLIDWESYVGASETGWSDFKKQRIATPKLFRLFASIDDYYSYEFDNPAKYLCLHLASADGFYFVKGYCERDSSMGRLISAMFATGPDRRAFTLRLAFPDHAQSDHCVRITGMVANRWLIVP